MCNRLRVGLSPGTTLGLLALVIAVGGTAIAAPSLLTKGEKKQVRNIAASKINALAPGLAVKAAGHADSADKLDGKSASDFAPAQQVQSASRVRNPCDPSNPSSCAGVDLISAGNFTINGQCIENLSGPTDAALLVMSGPAGSSYAGATTNNGAFNQTDFPGSIPIVDAESEGDAIGGVQLTAVDPNGQVVSVSASAEVNDSRSGDCIFGATTIGP